jgi:hypothetical protein
MTEHFGPALSPRSSFVAGGLLQLGADPLNPTRLVDDALK